MQPRRRAHRTPTPFSLLRLTGMSLVMLRRVVTLESAVPPLLGVTVSACAGFAAAAGLFLRAQFDQTLQPPTLIYYLVIAAGVIASLAIIATTNPSSHASPAPRRLA